MARVRNNGIMLSDSNRAEHRHNWLHVVVWLLYAKNDPAKPTIFGVWTSQDNFIIDYDRQGGTHPWIGKGYQNSGPETTFATKQPGILYPLVDWDHMPTRAQSALETGDFGGQPCPLKDSQFFDLMNAALPPLN